MNIAIASYLQICILDNSVPIAEGSTPSKQLSQPGADKMDARPMMHFGVLTCIMLQPAEGASDGRQVRESLVRADMYHVAACRGRIRRAPVP